jgi:probable F420-dependent oxidoreductase
MTRWGITLPLADIPLGDHEPIVRELAALGYTDAWTAETAGFDAFTPLALAAVWAPELRLGTAVVPVYTRGPALIAMSASALADLAPDRFVLGIGASSPVIVRNWNAGEFAEPYRKVRDMIRFLRHALAGERISAEYRTFKVDGFRLERAPGTVPPIMIAALRPGMLRLAAEEADGALTTWLSADDVRTVRAELGTGTELAGRLFVIPTSDASAARRLGRLMISSYLTVPAYAQFHDWLGRGDALRAMHEAWAAGDRKAANAAISDEVVDDLVVHGSPEQCRAHIQRYIASGLDTPIIQVFPAGGDAIELIRKLAPSP